MFDTIAISELQKSLSKILKSTKGFLVILSNNKVQGGIIDKELMQYLDETGVLEDYEDMRLLEQNKKYKKALIKKIEAGDTSDFLTFDELCRSN